MYFVYVHKTVKTRLECCILSYQERIRITISVAFQWLLYENNYLNKIGHCFCLPKHYCTSRVQIARTKTTERLHPPHRVGLCENSSVASVPTAQVLSCLHLSELRCLCCSGVGFSCNLEACNLVKATVFALNYLCPLASAFLSMTVMLRTQRKEQKKKPRVCYQLKAAKLSKQRLIISIAISLRLKSRATLSTAVNKQTNLISGVLFSTYVQGP
jgi:hypothetical protein